MASSCWSVPQLSSLLLIALLLLGLIHRSYSECSAGQFQCTNGNCVNAAFVCDDDNDCLDFSDEMNCRKELISENFLIVADAQRRNLYQVGIDTGEMVPVLPVKPQRPIAVTYDEVNNVVYWTDVRQRTIGRFALGDRLKAVQTVFTDTDASAVLDGLAIDATRQKLYYCDAGDVGRIGEISTNGSHRRILVEEHGTKPRSIVLDLNNRLMYWSDWGDTASIMRASMLDGSQKQILVTGALVWPNALAVDFNEQTMFWGDASLGKLEMSRTDGTGRQVIYSNTGDRYYNIAVSPQYLYITDWTERAVRKLDRQTFRISDQAPAVFGQLSGIIYCRCIRQSTVTTPRRLSTLSTITTTLSTTASTTQVSTFSTTKASTTVTTASTTPSTVRPSTTSTTPSTVRPSTTSTTSSTTASTSSTSTTMATVTSSLQADGKTSVTTSPADDVADADDKDASRDHEMNGLIKPAASREREDEGEEKSNEQRLIMIVSMSVGGFVLTALLITAAAVIAARRKRAYMLPVNFSRLQSSMAGFDNPELITACEGSMFSRQQLEEHTTSNAYDVIRDDAQENPTGANPRFNYTRFHE